MQHVSEINPPINSAHSGRVCLQCLLVRSCNIYRYPHYKSPPRDSVRPSSLLSSTTSTFNHKASLLLGVSAHFGGICTTRRRDIDDDQNDDHAHKRMRSKAGRRHAVVYATKTIRRRRRRGHAARAHKSFNSNINNRSAAAKRRKTCAKLLCLPMVVF